MSRILHHHELRLGEGTVQVPRTLHWADTVVAPLHDDTWQVSDLVDVLQDPFVALEEPCAHKPAVATVRLISAATDFSVRMRHYILPPSHRTGTPPHSQQVQPAGTISSREAGQKEQLSPSSTFVSEEVVLDASESQGVGVRLRFGLLRRIRKELRCRHLPARPRTGSTQLRVRVRIVRQAPPVRLHGRGAQTTGGGGVLTKY